MASEDEKFRKFDEAASWYQRVLAVDPRNREAYYSLGVIDWAKWYPNYMRARAQLGMRPEQPGPINNAVVRHNLEARYALVITDGIANFEKALEMDPQYDDAMAYLNLLIRERGDVRDTAEDCKRDVDVADRWVQKALATKSSKASVLASRYVAPPPPPLGDQQTPQRIQVGSVVTNNNLIRKVQPDYQQEARAAHIEGTVRFTATIGKDGRILNLQVVSGHPLLVESALAAVRQWEYKPTLINGQPVEIITTIDVNFTLSQ